jgi:hypothetical protein
MPSHIDLILFPHSLVDLSEVEVPFVGVHVVRDPRDVIVSGYLYHRRCEEAWCVNRDLNATEPILFPRVPWSQEHRSERWKREYLRSLDGKSYQQNLLGRNQTDGLLFEMEHCGRWTIESMMDWDYGHPSVLEIRFEDIMSNYDGTFRSVFQYIGLSGTRLEQAIGIAASEDLNRMTPREIQSNPHISSRRTSKWQLYFEDVHRRRFDQLFGDALVRLGYESSRFW